MQLRRVAPSLWQEVVLPMTLLHRHTLSLPLKAFKLVGPRCTCF